MVTFQFHKGTIRTLSLRDNLSLSLDFNSIKVRLELIMMSFALLMLSDFNSIKVRLEPCTAVRLSSPRTKFQFHKGTIRTLSRFLLLISHITNFNSIKVRLEQREALSRCEISEFQFHKGTIRTV